MFYTLLPLLKGWMYQYVEKTSAELGYIEVGKEKLIDVVEAPGFLLAAGLYLKGSKDAKYVRVHVEIDGPDKAYPIDFTADGLNAFGLVNPLNYGAFLTVYNDEEKVYAGALSPSQPIPFSKKFEVRLIPPSHPIEETQPLKISFHASYSLVKIIDVGMFKTSVREVLGGGVRPL